MQGNHTKGKRCVMDLISRQAAIDALCEAGLINYQATGDGNGMIHAVNVVKGLPSHPVIPQPEHKTGRWEITEAYPHNVYCSACHKKFAQTHWTVWEDGSLPRNYCPNCGAYMRG